MSDGGEEDPIDGPLGDLAGGMIVVGLVTLAVSMYFEFYDWLVAGAMVFVVGFMLIAMMTETETEKEWYCAACGQYLGEGTSYPGPCQRCGSNRWTNTDPGPGRAVRVEDDRRQW